MYASAYDVIAPRNYGLIAGILNMVGGFSGGAAVLLTGLLKEAFGTAYVIRVLAIASAVAAGLLSVVVLGYFAQDRAKIANART